MTLWVIVGLVGWIAVTVAVVLGLAVAVWLDRENYRRYVAEHEARRRRREMRRVK